MPNPVKVTINLIQVNHACGEPSTYEVEQDQRSEKLEAYLNLGQWLDAEKVWQEIENQRAAYEASLKRCCGGQCQCGSKNDNG